MEGIQHKFIKVNGITMHVAEAGGREGQAVLFIHGFPECWYTWRHQMLSAASHGYRALAPDLRGYGDTTGPDAADDPAKFTTLHVVGDLVALIDAEAGGGKVFVVGHDWGAQIAWALCLYRPDKVRAVVGMSVFYSPRNPEKKPVERLRSVYGDDYYICRFQEKGEIEGEFAVIGAERVIVGSLAIRTPASVYLPKGKPFEETPERLPSWLTQNDVDFYVSKFEKRGFTGALNYYRALDFNWELTAAWGGKTTVTVPAKFIVGELDITYSAPGAKEYLHGGGLKANVPLLEEVVVLKGVAHFLHEEKPEEVNAHIFSFLRNFSQVSK